MQGSQPASTFASPDASRDALNFVHRLLATRGPDPRPLGQLLAGLAEVFRASGAGLAPPDGAPLVRHPDAAEPPRARWPWEEEADLLTAVRQARTAVAVTRPGADTFLLTTVPAPDHVTWLLWLERPGRSPWREAEAATLALAGQALGRCLDGGGNAARWADQLERAARQNKLELAALLTRRLAHDFGNVLTGILGFSELALTQPVPANTPLHCYLTEVHRGAQSGAQYTSQLRLFSRRQAPPGRGCTLAAVLTEEEARLRPAREAGLSLHVAVPPDLPPLALDADQLRQVLAALLDNAREALPAGGSVTVSARVTILTEADCHDLFGDPRPGPHVEVCVADTGSGLNPEVQRQLFQDPFFSTKHRRRGFGLATAYGILHAHRGGLRLYPGAEYGVVARILVPAAAAPSPVPACAPAEQPARGEKVLVVDDDPMILQFVSTTLERAGYRVQAVSNAEDALTSYTGAALDPFRLVLSDVIMPNVSGVDLARRLLTRDANVRVLFMSGQVTADFAHPDFASHQFELLPKPFRPEGLLRAVRSALDRTTPRRAQARAGTQGEGPRVSSSR